VPAAAYALSPDEFLRSVAATRDTLGKRRMKLLDIVSEVRALSMEAPYAVIGGLAQILWARKTHTDDLDLALAAPDLISVQNEPFNSEILTTSVSVSELGGIFFVRPELLLVTHLLRPGPQAAIAAVELILARREAGTFDVNESRVWAERLGRAERLDRALRHADTFALE